MTQLTMTREMKPSENMLNPLGTTGLEKDIMVPRSQLSVERGIGIIEGKQIPTRGVLDSRSQTALCDPTSTSQKPNPTVEESQKVKHAKGQGKDPSQARAPHSKGLAHCVGAG